MCQSLYLVQQNYSTRTRYMFNFSYCSCLLLALKICWAQNQSIFCESECQALVFDEPGSILIHLCASNQTSVEHVNMLRPYCQSSQVGSSTLIFLGALSRVMLFFQRGYGTMSALLFKGLITRHLSVCTNNAVNAQNGCNWLD